MGNELFQNTPEDILFSWLDSPEAVRTEIARLRCKADAHSRNADALNLYALERGLLMTTQDKEDK
jgi:hypothetical protein